MNKHKKNLLALSIAGMGALTALYSVSAASITTGTSVPNVSTTRTFGVGHVDNVNHIAIKTAITNGDYQAFLTATKNKPEGVAAITQEQFNVMVAAEKLRASGDTVGAKKLLTDAGIKGRGMAMGGKVHMKGKGSKGAFISTLTDAQKATLEQVHTLIKSGNKTEAQALLKNSGIVFPTRKNVTTTQSTQ